MDTSGLHDRPKRFGGTIRETRERKTRHAHLFHNGMRCVDEEQRASYVASDPQK